MDCWRYEYPDGGGPWFYPDGTARGPWQNAPDNNQDDLLYGCDAIENLDRYMHERGVNTVGMELVHYKDVIVINYNRRNGHIIFKLR